MALVPIQGSGKRKLSDLEKISVGLNIVSDTLGIALAVPKAIQSFRDNKQDSAFKQKQAARQDEQFKAQIAKDFVEVPGVQETIQQPDIQQPKPIQPSLDQPEPFSLGGREAGFVAPGATETTTTRPEGAFEFKTAGLEDRFFQPITAGGITPIQRLNLEIKTKPFMGEQELKENERIIDLTQAGLGKRVVTDKLAPQRNRDEQTVFLTALTAMGMRRGAATVMGRAINRTVLANNALALIDKAERDPNFQASSQFATDLGMVLASIMGGGNSPAEATVRAMVPESALGSFRALKQFFLGDPQDYLTPGFLEQFREAMQREIIFWKSETDKIVGSITNLMRPIFSRNKDLEKDWEKVMANRFLLQNPHFTPGSDEAILQGWGFGKSSNPPVQTESGSLQKDIANSVNDARKTLIQSQQPQQQFGLNDLGDFEIQ